MATSRGSTWIETDDTYRTGDAAGTPYVTIEGVPGSGELSLFFAGDRKSDSSQVECIDAMIAALQQLRSDTLRRMAPDWSHPYGPCPARSIAHTHCRTCGNDSVTHNRAECSIVAEQRDGTALPHPADDGAQVPHRSIVNRRGMALHLIADHHVDANMADLLDVTAEALEKRHRVEHLNAGDSAGVGLPAVTV